LGSGAPAAQLPAPSHFSTPLHGLPSAHDVPAARFAPGTHTPAALHVPAPWQALPAEHATPGVTVYVMAPVAGLQVPTVQMGPLLRLTGVPAQLPAVQTSPVVQGLPSLQALPFAAVGFEQVPVVGLHVPGAWHWSDAAHVTAVPAHEPLVQTSPVVHALPSLHAVAFAAVGFEQVPVLGLHVPATWHWSDAAHATAVPPHTPLVQTSPVVHALPSLHAVPSATAGFEQVPVLRLHVPAVWHWSDAAHATAAPPHMPPVQTSPVVHALPSLHAVPFAAVGFEHTPVLGLQVPAAWHWSDAAHVTAVPAHAPLVQTSPVVHALPSLHAVPFVAAGFEHAPVLGLQVPAT
jgi:hypothetical protein